MDTAATRPPATAAPEQAADPAGTRPDVTMMYVFHDALRRDLRQVVAMAHRSEGWDAFVTFLRLHHQAEDAVLWPMLREAVAGDPESVAIVDEMEHEHEGVEACIDTIEAAFDRGGHAPEAQAELAEHLEEHLAHEEGEVLPLVQRALTQEQWTQFGQAGSQRVADDLPRFLPWLLDGAGAEGTERVLATMPPPIRQSHEDEWRRAHHARDRWAA